MRGDPEDERMAAATRIGMGINTDYDPEIDLETRLRVCADAGFINIHWAEDFRGRTFFDAAFVARIASLLDRLALSLSDMHNPAPSDHDIQCDDPEVRASGMAVLENRIAATGDLGGDAVVVHPAAAAGRGRVNSFDVFDRVADSCLSRGVRLSLEADTEADAEPYFQRYPPEIMGYCFDSGHCNVQTPPTPHLLEKYANRLCVTHLHDNYGEHDDHRLPFDGTVPWDRVMAVFAGIGHDKPLTLEVARLTYVRGDYLETEKRMAHDQFIAEAARRAARLCGMGRRSHG